MVTTGISQNKQEMKYPEENLDIAYIIMNDKKEELKNIEREQNVMIAIGKTSIFVKGNPDNVGRASDEV
jgi:hypothetical protein